MTGKKETSEKQQPDPGSHESTDNRPKEDLYKKCISICKWVVRVVVILIISFVSLAFIALGCLMWQGNKAYKEACAKAEQSCKKTREYELEAPQKREDVNALAAVKLDEIEDADKEERQKTPGEAERHRKVSELFNKALIADKAKDYETAADCYRQIDEEHREERYFAVYYNWSVALAGLAERKEGAEAEELFNQAIEKYKKAVEINPDVYEVYHSWGCVLLYLAKSKEGPEEEELLNQAIGKYQKAVEIKPDSGYSYYNWGFALLRLAFCKEGPEEEELLIQAIGKYQKAIEIKPYLYRAYRDRCIALLFLAVSKW